MIVMKNLLLILAFAFFAACAGNSDTREISKEEEPSNILENITFTIYAWYSQNGGEIVNNFLNNNIFTFSVVGVKE
jgi:uncharacterized lipoprotein YajG